MIFENYINIEVNSFFRANTIGQKIKENVFSDQIDIIEDIEDTDIILGSYKIESYQLPTLSLENTENVIYDIGERLIDANLAGIDDIYDIRTILEYISGSAGYKRAKTVVNELDMVSLTLLISWMHAYSRFRFSSISDLNIATSVEDKEQANMKIADILDFYFLEHQGKGGMVKINAVIVPCYYWIQQIRERKKEG